MPNFTHEDFALGSLTDALELGFSYTQYDGKIVVVYDEDYPNRKDTFVIINRGKGITDAKLQLMGIMCAGLNASEKERRVHLLDTPRGPA